MDALLILTPFVAGALLWFGARRLERATHRPGLSFLIGGVIMAVGALAGVANGQWLLPAIFAFQSVGFFYFAHWTRARHDDIGTDRDAVDDRGTRADPPARTNGDAA